MSEEPKSIWKKSWRGTGSLLLAWLGLMIVGWLIFWAIMLATGTRITHEELKLWAALELVATIALLLVLAVRWLCCWRNVKKVAFGMACFATLIALFYAEENWRGKRAWEEFKREWKSKGIDLEWANNIPANVPDEQNFALTPIVSSSYETYFDKQGHEVKPRNTNVVDRFTMLGWRDLSYNRKEVPESVGWQAGEKLDLKAWQAYFRTPPPDVDKTNSFPVSSNPQMPADDVLLALSRYGSELEEIRQARRLTESRYPLTYESGDVASILLPHLSALRSTVKAIRLKSVAELQKQQPSRALEDATLCLGLVDAIRTEPFLISLTVRRVMLAEAIQPVWEGLADHRWSESQLIILDAELAKIDLIADCRRAQVSEMAGAGKIAQYLSQHRNYAAWFAQNGLNFSKNKDSKLYFCRYMPEGWFYQSAKKNARFGFQYMIAVNPEKQTVSPKLIEQVDESMRYPASFFDPLSIFGEMFSVDDFHMQKFISKISSAQTSVNLARTAIALERYWLAHRNYPESLEVLAPQFIAKVPHDVIGGGSLKYRLETNGTFTLYSIGWNEKDDGGVVVLTKRSTPEVDIKQGDWVWKYPKK